MKSDARSDYEWRRRKAAFLEARRQSFPFVDLILKIKCSAATKFRVFDNQIEEYMDDESQAVV